MRGGQKSVFCFLFAGLSGLFFSSNTLAKGGKESSSSNARPTTESVNNTMPAAVSFQWKEHNVLSWEDFKGPVRANNEESAAATHCGIGFKLSASKEGTQPQIIVYNNFYINKSWVKPDAMMPEILCHEQGHFDLCEIYTRKLNNKMNSFSASAVADKNIHQALMSLYLEVKNEYEDRQQQYEEQTLHGTIKGQQKKWQKMIATELNTSEAIVSIN